MQATILFWSAAVLIALIAAAVYVVYKFRQASQERRQRSEERAAEMLLAVHKDAAPRDSSGAAATTPGIPRVRSPAPVAPALASTLTRRLRILNDAQRTLYLELRTALPDHTIMAHIRIVDLLDLPAGRAALERETRMRELLREHLDFVICNSDLVPVAGLVLYESGTELVPDERIKVESLRELGMRFLRFRADSLPRAAEIRSLVLP
jgi:hypothetical protein